MVWKRNKSAAPAEAAVQPQAKARAARQYYDPVIDVAVDRNRWVLVAGIAIALNFLLGFALTQLTPLKEVVPYVLEVDAKTQRAVASSRLKHYAPTNNTVAFETAEWVEKVLTINRHLLEINLREAQGRTCGVAREQLNRFVRETKPKAKLIQDPNLTREVLFLSDPVFPTGAENTVLLRVKTIEDGLREGKADSIETFWAATINYALRPIGQKITFDKFRKNPTGLCITSFLIQEER